MTMVSGASLDTARTTGPTYEVQDQDAGDTPAAIGFDLKAALLRMVREGASDLHLKVGKPPTLRLHGDLMPIKFRDLGDSELEGYVDEEPARVLFRALGVVILRASIEHHALPIVPSISVTTDRALRPTAISVAEANPVQLP